MCYTVFVRLRHFHKVVAAYVLVVCGFGHLYEVVYALLDEA
jgi:hypothetical protein